MRLTPTGILGTYFGKRALRHWDRLAEEVREADLDSLRAIRADARAVAQRINTIRHIADQRLALPVIGSNAMELPPSTDWSYRPELWTGPVSPSGHAPARRQNPFGREVTVYHDCHNDSICLRQLRNTRAEDMAPFGIKLDVFDFQGSFLSLVLQAPPEAVRGLRRRHVLRLGLRFESESPVGITARINLKHGPNTEQVDRPVDTGSADSATEFDLAYVPFKDDRADQLWIDLFLESPGMNEIRLRDLTLSRHLRAEI